MENDQAFLHSTETFTLRRGWVNKILSHSFVDGPGNRAVIFLQGCNLNCLYCHNPYTINLCDHCGLCVETCPNGALAWESGLVIWNRELCKECDTCIQTCQSSSSPRALSLSAQELWEAIKPASHFISGVSISGGEPVLQAELVAEFFGIVKRSSPLTTLIETNGHAGPPAYLPLLKHLDMAIVDLKAIDPRRYLELTGGELAPTLETIRFLHGQHKLYAVQQVVVPDFTDSEQSAANTARFLSALDPNIRLKFLRFRPHGTAGPAEKWASPSDEVMDRMVQTARQQGLLHVERSL
jgi:YjjW family glycine radical enzyme activase